MQADKIRVSGKVECKWKNGKRTEKREKKETLWCKRNRMIWSWRRVTTGLGNNCEGLNNSKSALSDFMWPLVPIDLPNFCHMIFLKKSDYTTLFA